MEIYLVRHTTPDIAKGVCYGQTDLDVTDTFISESKEVRRKLDRFGVSDQADYYASPLKRCRVLAEAQTDAPITFDDRLMEMHFGEWEMQAWDSIDEQKLRHWTDDYVHVPCPEGESFTGFYQRVESFIDGLKETDVLNEDRPIVIVTHGGVIRCFFCYLGLTTLKDCFEKSVEYGDVFRIRVGDDDTARVDAG